MTTEMNWRNIGTDHVRPIASFDVSKDEELGEAFNWKNKIINKRELNFLDYQLQFIEAYQFIKLNEERSNEDFRR